MTLWRLGRSIAQSSRAKDVLRGRSMVRSGADSGWRLPPVQESGCRAGTEMTLGLSRGYLTSVGASKHELIPKQYLPGNYVAGSPRFFGFFSWEGSKKRNYWNHYLNKKEVPKNEDKTEPVEALASHVFDVDKPI